MNLRRNQLLGLIAAALVVNLALCLAMTRYAASFAVLWILPGLAWAWLLAARRRRWPGADDTAIGLALGIASVSLATLLLHYLPGPLTMAPLLIAVNALTGLLAGLASRCRPHLDNSESSPRAEWAPWVSVLLIIGLSTVLRTVHLDYSEFQGDEAVIMARAGRAIAGEDAQVFYHYKGPGEILVPLATWTLSGTINEWQARLPFAYICVLGLVGFYLVGRRWFGWRTAAVATSLLSLNGYFVGFGRIVQYQGLVLAGTTLGLLALWRWTQEDERSWIIVSAVLLAFGAMAHYDTVMSLPVAGYVLIRHIWLDRVNRRGHIRRALLAALLAAAVLALFYMPYVLHPSFSRTMRYLSGARLSGGGPLYNNLIASLSTNTFYNSTYYLGIGTVLLVVAVFAGFQRRRVLVPIFGCVLLVGSLAIPAIHLLTGPVFAVLLLMLIVGGRLTVPARAAWIWFAVPFIFYYFLVRNPITHVLNTFPGATLIASSTLVGLVDRIARRRVRTMLWGVCLVLFLFLAYYPYLMFVQHVHEIKRTWPDHRPSLYWRPHREAPVTGFFGFPYQAGWKVIGAMVEQGIIHGAYGSNEEPEITTWYVPYMERSYCPGPEWYFIAKNVQDVMPTDQAEIEAEYHLWGDVRVGGEPKLWIYRRGTSDAAPGSYDAEDYSAYFDSRTRPENLVLPPGGGYIDARYRLGEDIELLGYRLDASEAQPGGIIRLTLYWEALRPISADYKVFVHLYDGNTMWGQMDSIPGCELWPIVYWDPGRIVRDDYIVPVAIDAPRVEIPLRVGMYSLQDAHERLPIYDNTGSFIGDSLTLTVARIQ
ncbi:MAG: phospholipid carrier-dependent glycosyltransferase [Chloroflexi bacterium]|nr:phospholipid carrier-dependent glycosyltransferase [Chloroflexota bacterium]